MVKEARRWSWWRWERRVGRFFISCNPMKIRMEI
jgi:hypothetical protein